MYQCINVSMYLCLYVVYLSIYWSVWFCQQETATQDARHKRIASAILVVRGSKLYTSKHTPMGQSDGDCHWSWVIFWSPSFSWPQDHNGIYSSKTTRVWNSRSLQKLNRKPGPGQFLLVLEVMKTCHEHLQCEPAMSYRDCFSSTAPAPGRLHVWLPWYIHSKDQGGHSVTPHAWISWISWILSRRIHEEHLREAEGDDSHSNAVWLREKMG